MVGAHILNIAKQDLNNYLFEQAKEQLANEEADVITDKLRIEMDEIFYRKNTAPPKGF